MLLAATCCVCCHGACKKPCQVAGTNVREQVARWDPNCYPLEVKVPRDLEPCAPWLGPYCEQFKRRGWFQQEVTNKEGCALSLISQILVCVTCLVWSFWIISNCSTCKYKRQR